MSLSSSIEFEGSIYRNGQKDSSAVNGFDGSLPSSTFHNSQNVLVRSSPSSVQRRRSSGQDDLEQRENNAKNDISKVTDRYGFITKQDEDSAASFHE